MVVYDLIKSAGKHSVVASVCLGEERIILNVILPVCCIAVLYPTQEEIIPFIVCRCSFETSKCICISLLGKVDNLLNQH